MPWPFSSRSASDKVLVTSSDILLHYVGSLRALFCEIISASWWHVVEVLKTLRRVLSIHPAVRSGTACCRNLIINMLWCLQSFPIHVGETARIEASCAEHARSES